MGSSTSKAEVVIAQTAASNDNNGDGNNSAGVEHLEMSEEEEVEPNNEGTILGCLNEYCWREILGYIPVRDILRTERVSRQWQHVVLVYLRRSARFGIDHPYYRGSKTDICWLTPKRACYAEGTPEYAALKCWLQKHGPEVVANYCNSEDHLRIYRDNCPNLESLAMVHCKHPLPVPRNSKNGTFKLLKQCEFLSCAVTDYCISQFICSNALEEFTIVANMRVTGECLVKIVSPNLKTLVFKDCEALETCHMLSAIDQLSGLKKLVLNWLPLVVYEEIHLVLKRLLKLEYLHISTNPMRNGKLIDAICCLRSLKDLSMTFDAVDKDVEDLVRCCGELRSLTLEGSNKVKERAVAALCEQAGERLTKLDFGRARLEDGDVEAVIFGCPNLTALNVSGCLRLSLAVLRRAAAARREANDTPLHLFLPQALEPGKVKYDELVVEYCYS